MEKVKDYPKEGQFVVVWEYDDKIWSGVYKWKKGVLYEYHLKKAKFCEATSPSWEAWGYDNTCVKKLFVK